MTLRILAAKVSVIVGTVWTIIHDRLHYLKVCAHGVLKQLTGQQKKLSMGITIQRLFRYHEDPAFLEHQPAMCCSRLISTICWIPRAQRNHHLWCVLWDTVKPTQVHQEQRQELLIESVVLLHDKARPGLSRAKFKREQLHQPPYSQDMSPGDFYVFGLPEKTSEWIALQIGSWTQGRWRAKLLFLQKILKFELTAKRFASVG